MNQEELELLNRKARIEKYKKKKKRRNIIITVILVTVLIIGAFIYRVANNFFNLVDALPSKDGNSATVIENVQDTPFSVLIMGVGTNGNDGEASNADAIMLATISPKTNTAELISIPRDSYLQRGSQCDAAGYYDKITHSGASPACLESTLEELFDLDINYYVSVNFKGFVEIVDSIGGVNMEVPDLRPGFEAWTGDASDGTYLDASLKTGDQWCEHDSNRLPYAVCFNAFGMQNVDGEHALALSRTRHYDSDFARGNRQNELIKAIIEKALSPSGLLSVDKLLTAINGNVETNIPQNQILDFAKLGKSMFSSKSGTTLQIRATQLQGLSGTFEGELSGRASYNVVPIRSVENIRKKIAYTLEGHPLDTDVESFNFDEMYYNEYAPYFGAPYLGMEYYGLKDVQSFRTV